MFKWYLRINILVSATYFQHSEGGNGEMVNELKFQTDMI